MSLEASPPLLAPNPSKNFKFYAVILLDWSGVDLTPKSTPYAEEAVELQDSNMTPDQIYTIILLLSLNALININKLERIG